MRQYHTTVKETKEIDKIICNRCGRSIPVIQGVPREDVLEVSKRWGYFSEKDNRLDEFDLCEQCYDEIINLIQSLHEYPDAEENQKQADRQDICLAAPDKR